jgi:hypothetical protein
MVFPPALRVFPLLLVLIFATGCFGPEQHLVGAWTVDRQNTQIPPLQFPGSRAQRAEERIRRNLDTALLKLRADRTFTFAFLRNLEGSWELDEREGLLILRPNEPPEGMEEIVMTLGRDRRSMTFEQSTPLGKVIVVLSKNS